MENSNVVKMTTAWVAGAVSAVSAWLFARMGVLLYVILFLTIAMVIDYFTGMMASRIEAIDNPDNPEYGWNSRKGAKGIIKKFGYMCVIAVAMMVDYIILYVSGELGMEIGLKAFFGILVTVWYLLNEILSIIENAGRMGAPVPDWLKRYVAVLKDRIEQKGE